MTNIDERIIKARSALVMGHPFFGVLAMKLIIALREDIKTMATDGTYLYYCRAFLDKVSESDLIFTIAHEVLHCALSHMTRRNGRRWDLWQAATDYIVNWMLHEAGFKIPDWVKYHDVRFAGMSVETAYDILLSEEPKQPDEPQPQDQPDPQDGDDDDDQQQTDDQDPDEDDDAKSETDEASASGSGDEDEEGDDEYDKDTSGTSPSEDAEGSEAGSGSPDQPTDGGSSESLDGPSNQSGTPDPSHQPAPSYGDPGGCGEVLDAAPPHDKNKLDDVASEWQVYTRQAANIARRAGEGRAPGFVEEIINELNTPQTDWRDALRRFVDPMSSTKDFTWSRPNIRHLVQGYYTPGMISDGINHVVLVIDTSISIDQEWLKKFGGESQAALDDGAIDKVTLIFIDEVVHRTAEYSKGEVIDFTVQGRGGTRFRPAFEWIKDNIPDPAVAVYFTDLDSSDFGDDPGFPVMWAAYDSNPIALRSRMDKVPFGEVIELRQ